MTITTIRTRRAKPRELEDREQRAVMRWLRLQYPAVYKRTTHVPNGGHRHKAVAGKLNALGVKRGVPDLLCFVPSRGFVGLAVEMKRPGAPPSATSEEQHEWLRHLAGIGWHACVCRGFEEAKTAFEGYLA